MNRNEYLTKLREYLSDMPREEMQEILYDYEEHFRSGIAEGKTEEEVAAALGDVKASARLYRADFTLEQARENASPRNMVKAVLAAIGLSFFNLIFVLGPFFGVVGVLIGLFGASVGITLAGVALGGVSMLQPVFPAFVDLDGASHIFLFAVSVGLTCLGILFTLGNIWISRCFYHLTLTYLQWNIDVVKK